MKINLNKPKKVYISFSKVIVIVFLYFFFINNSYSQRTIEQAHEFALEKIKNFDFDTSKETNQIANYYIESNPTIFADTEGITSAYMFKIFKNNIYFGYITVNALNEYYPLIEIAYNIEWLPNRIEELISVVKNHPEYTDKNWNFEKFIFLGGQDYLALYKNANQQLYISLVSKLIIFDNIISERLKLWNNKRQILVNSKQSQKKNAELSSSKSISGVKAYTWYRGCSTTALSMILDYWGEHGFSKLDYASTSFTWNGPSDWFIWTFCTSKNPTITKDLADLLASSMEISDECQGNNGGNWGSTADQQRNAILSVTSSKGYNFISEIDNTYSFTKYKAEIDANRPIKIGYNVDNKIDGAHAVCGLGYNYDGSTHLLQYNNTWDLGTHWMTAENEWINNWVIICPKLSDLKPVYQSLSSASIESGSNVTAYCAEDNSGPVSAGANVISVHLSANNILTPGLNGDRYLDEFNISGVSAFNSSNIYSKSIKIPSDVPPGPYYVFFSVDGGSVVDEIFENNNFVSVPITVTAAATLNPPRNLSATTGNGQVSLSWSAPSSGIPTGYDIFKSMSQTGEYTLINQNITTLNKTITGLSNGTTYWFSVSAKYSSGSSNPSNIVSATPTSGTATYNPPRNLSAMAGNGEVSLSWSAPSSGTPSSYNIYKSSSENGSYSFSSSTTSTSKTVTGLTNGTTYWFYITAVYASGISDPSNKDSAVPAGSSGSNDDCSGARLLTSSTSCNFLENQTVNNATASGKPQGSCDNWAAPDLDDVWYYFKATATSHKITVDPNGSELDAVIVAYNSCSDNSQLNCSDISGGKGVLSTLNLSGLTVGNYYYIRVYDYGTQTTNGGFRICVTGASSNNTCTYSLSQTARNFSYSGGTGSFTINATAGAGCTWDVSTSPASEYDLANITSIDQGTGPYTITYDIDPNPTNHNLSCTLTVTGKNGYSQDYFITQDANTTCDPSPSATTANFTSSGGAGSFKINVGPACFWNIYNSCSSMLTNITPTDGVGPTTVTYNVISNPNSTSRSCTIRIQQNNKSYTVTQQGNCTTPSAPTLGTITHPTCTVATGSVVLNGLPAIGTWTLTKSPGGETSTGTGTSKIIASLATGSYTYTVTDAAGCISTPSASVVINPQPSPLTAPIIGQITNPTCTVSTGSLILSGLPASGSWTLTRTPGGVTSSGAGASTIIAGIAAGTYTYTYTNAAGCTSLASANIVINAFTASPSAPIVGAITHPTCTLATGSVVLSGLPAAGSWTLTRTPGGETTTGTGTSKTLSGLAAGTYTYAYKNESGCNSISSANVVIKDQPVTPSAPIVGLITNPTCTLAAGSVVLSGLPVNGTWTLTRNPGGLTNSGTGTSTSIAGIPAGTYTFTVTNASGCPSLPSTNVVVDIQPSIPAIASSNSATSLSQTGFNANWNTSAKATGYRLDVATNTGFTTFVSGYSDKDVSNVTTFNVTGLYANTTYYYRVRAFNLCGANTSSGTITATTLPNPPTPPTVKPATATLQTSFTANWNSSAIATGYRLDVATNAGFTSFVAGLNDKDIGNITTFSIAGLSVHTQYYYRVRAYNTGGTGANSNAAAVSTLSNPPAVPTGLTVSSCNNLVTLKWRKNSDPYFMRYRIYGGLTNNPTSKMDSTSISISDTSKVISGLINGKTYYFRVTAVNNDGPESVFSTQSSTIVKSGVIPEIKAKWGDLLICYNLDNLISNYQWYKGSTLIPNAIGQYYSAEKQAGIYLVETIDKDGCKNSSNTIQITAGTKSLTVYPNPASVSFALKIMDTSELKSTSVENVTVSLINSAGQKVLELQARNANDELLKAIPVSNLVNGVYIVQVLLNNKELHYVKIVVLK